MLTAVGRPRGVRRTLSPSIRAGIKETLDRGPERQRLVLALLLVERLSLKEAAGVLRISVSRLERSYREIMTRLGSVADGGAVPAAKTSRLGRSKAHGDRLRKAS